MLDYLFSREQRATTWDPWPGDHVPTWAGMSVTPDSSMQLLAVYGCVQLISETISTLPVDVFRSTPDGPVPAPTPDWLRQPTPWLSFTDWCSQVLLSLLLDGNAYVNVLRDMSGSIRSLEPLDPATVIVERVNGAKVYRIKGMPSSAEIVHLKGMMLPGADVGMSPIEAARQTIGLGLSALQFGSQFFDGEGNMPGVIEIPGTPGPEQIKELASQWRRKRSRSGKGLPGVLHSGASWRPTGVTNEQAQFLATRQFTDSQIAGEMFLIDPSELGIPVQGTSLTYANLEQRGARLTRTTLLRWIARIEFALSLLLARPRYVKLNVEGLMRGDLKSRFEAYQIAIGSKFMVPNEARRFEDWKPLPGGDEVEATPAPPVPTEDEDAA